MSDGVALERGRGLGSGAAFGLAFLCGCWGLNQVAMKAALAGIPPLAQTGLRSLLAAAIVVALCRWRRLPLFERDGTLPAGLIVGLLFGGEFIALYAGLGLTTASHSVILLYSHPFIVAVAGRFLLDERLGATQVAGMMLAFIGVALTFAGDDPNSQSSLAGDLLCLLAAFLWGATTVVIKASRLARARPEKTLLYQLAVSAALGIGLSLLLERGATFAATPLVATAFIYQVAIASFTYLAWFGFLQVYPAAIVTSFTFLTPVFGVLAGVLLLAEPLTARLAFGLALVATGIYLVNRRRIEDRDIGAFGERRRWLRRR